MLEFLYIIYINNTIHRASDASNESENEERRPKTVWYALRDADSSLGCELMQDPSYSKRKKTSAGDMTMLLREFLYLSYIYKFIYTAVRIEIQY